MTSRPPRVALYSHDTMGLGHMRRNLLIAEALATSPQTPSILLIVGSRESARFPMPPGVDVLSLPALYKDAQARYHARSLDVPLAEIVDLRSTAIRAAVESFSPDVFIVDNVPRGALGELDSALELLRRRGRTRCVLGLRDVLDDAEQVRAEWAKAQNIAAVRRYYDRVWVYGDQNVLDVGREYRLPPDIRKRIQYTGYLDQRSRRAPLGHTPSGDGRVVSCLLGGGQDGLALASAFVQAELPTPYERVLVTGPMMSPASRDTVFNLAGARSRLSIVEFVNDPAALMRSSESVITMGGYNSVCDVLSHDVRALVVPRVRPRTEQLIRATSLARRGLLDVLHPDALTPGALRDWVCTPPVPRPRESVRLHTNDELQGLLSEVLTVPSKRPAAIATEVRHAS